MSTNQVLLTLGAFIIFSLMLVSFYKLLANSGDMINNAQAGISELSFATTYMELAQGLAFDEATIDSNRHTVNDLTLTSNLGPDNPPPFGEPTEDGFNHFDDFDDLNNFEITDTTQKGIAGIFKTHFNVHYVNPTNINQISTPRTFVKRLDMWVLRISPPSKDTLKASLILGYFHFD